MTTRTTLTLEDDVIERLREEAQRSGVPFKDVVNAALRAGLARREEQPAEPYRVPARDMGLRPGVDLDDVGGLLERLEGPLHR